MTETTRTPDLQKVTKLSLDRVSNPLDENLRGLLQEAREYLRGFSWCGAIRDEYLGLFVDGIIGVFLFHIDATKPGVDPWIWVVVGDLPPAYLTCDECPNPATALDGYIGAMAEWVDAAAQGAPVTELIPVNVPATNENADSLRKRLEFLDERILANLKGDLTSG